MVKAPLEAELKIFLAHQRNERDSRVVYVNAYGNHDLFENMMLAGDVRRLPDLVAHLGFGFPFQRKFRECFVDTGVFRSLSFPWARPSLAQRGIVDPRGNYTVLAINPMVMVADHTKLGVRPVPARWADILEPEYKRSVGVVGRGESFNEALALTIYKEFGLSGIEKLRRAIAFAGHPAQMVKMAGKAHPEAPAISIVDYFFAKMIKRQDRISIIWPEEGALAIPFLLLARSDRVENAGGIAAFLTGPRTARICADAYYYPLHGGVPARLPESSRLNWLGWDYLRQNDLESVMNEIRGSRGGGE